MRAIVAIMILATAFSGCAEGPQFEPTDSVDETPVDDTNATVVENVTVEELVPAFTVSIAGNLTEAVNGTFVVPADTNITFDAGNSTGNITSYTWTVGNATYDGAVVDILFPAGNHTLNLTLAGANQTAAATIPVSAAGTDAPLALAGSTEISFSRAAETWADGCKSAEQAYDFPEGTQTQYMHVELDPSWTGVALNIAYRIYVFDAEGTEVAKAARSGGSNNLVLDNAELDLPGGTYTVRGEICSTFSPQVSFTVKGTADHYA